MTPLSFISSDWFKTEFQDKLGDRYCSQKIALNILSQLSSNPVILETGTIRQENDWGAGMSTYVYGKYVSRYGGHVTTVDISEKNMEICKKVTSKYSDNITYVVANSLEYLSNINGKIDMLYLDSMDCPIDGDASVSQYHNLKEFIICEKHLSEQAIILIDDVNFSNGGKALKTHEYLKDNNYLLIYTGQQSIWIK